MGEADWVLYLVIAVSAGAIIWTLWGVGAKILNDLSGHRIYMREVRHRDVDRVIKSLGTLEYQLKQVRMELRKLRGLDVDEDAFR